MPIHDSKQQQHNHYNCNSNSSKSSSNQVNSPSSSTSSTCRVVKGKSNNTKTINISSADPKSTSSGDSALSTSNNKGSLISSNRQANDGSSASAMSNLSSDYYIDDDHIDDQETINVGNLIIDLESDLEKEKIENEQQANAKPSTCSTTTKTSTNAAPSSSSNHSSTSSTTSSASSTANTPAFSSNKGNKASSSTGNVNSISSASGKSNQKSSGKSAVNNNNTINNSTTSSIIDNSNNAINCSSSSSNINNNNNNNNNNNGHSAASGRAVFKSSSDERGELKMRITRETMPGKSEHKIVTSPNQKSPTSSSNNAGCNANVSSAHSNSYDEALMQKSPSSKPSQSSSISSTKECGTSTSIGTITEPECLGPCEPGTSVTLEGIVWQETDGGILVVNVTWRGKTYVGALLDCTKHDWAPPRLCDSPASDIDSKTSKGVRTKRIVTRSNGIGLDEKNLLQTTGKLRNGKGRRILAPSDLASCSKKQRDSEKSNESGTTQLEASGTTNVSSNSNSENSTNVPMNIDTAPNDSISTSNMTSDKTGPNSPMLIGCNEPNCSKKYRNINGLLYHQTHAHSNDNDSSNLTQENSCSSSMKPQNVSKDDQSEETIIPIASETPPSPLPEPKREHDVQKPPTHPETKIEHSLNNHTSRKETAPDITMNMNLPMNQESRPPVVKNFDSERRSSSNSGHHLSDFGRKSPTAPRHSADHGHGSSTHSSSSFKQGNSGGVPKQPMTAPMPPPTEEGMKPSGTSTGPPPAPHQANCYFNPAFLANTFNPYISPYFPRMPPIPMYDPMAPATSNAFLSRFMSNVRPPPPPTSESPSRLLSPSVPKNLPFPPFKIEPGMPPIPTSHMANPVGLAISPMTHPPSLAGNSPHLRMPSHGDPLMPPTSQAPIPPPPSLNPLLGLPGPMNPMGPLGGPQVPSLVDDTLAKQFPRRFN